MSSKRERQRVWPAAGVLAVSALVHIALLFLPLPGPRHETARSEPSSLRVELVAIPSPPAATEETQPPQEPAEQPSREPSEGGTSMPAEATEPETVAGIEPPIESASPSPEVAAPEPASDAIRAQLLGTARNLGRESEQSEQGRGLDYRAVPELPSQPGWLHRYTGRVAPSIDRWRGNDGSSNARIVTGSGQVVCVRTRAPTTAEIFNPWMSSALPMMSFCGRERPEGVDRADPWLRRPQGDGE